MGRAAQEIFRTSEQANDEQRTTRSEHLGERRVFLKLSKFENKLPIFIKMLPMPQSWCNNARLDRNRTFLINLPRVGT